MQDLITNIFGREIRTSSDCSELSEHIWLVTGKKISPTTLKRFFGVINDRGVIGNSSLLILKEYVGGYKRNVNLSNQEIQLIKDFYSIEVSDINDFNYQKACGNIARRIIENENLLIKMSGFLAKNKSAQIYFFERFPMIDLLANENYLKSLRQYAYSKKTNESYIYFYSLRILGAFLKKDEAALSDAFQKLSKYKLNSLLHPFIQGRYISSNLMYYHFINDQKNFNKWKDIAVKNELTIPRGNAKEAYFPMYQYTLIDCFNLLGEYDLSNQFFKICEYDYKFNYSSPIEPGYYESFDLMKSYCYYNLGYKEEAKRIFKKITVSNLLFIHQKYYMFFYNFLKSKFSTEKKNNQKLVKETGFYYFQNNLITKIYDS